MKSEDMEDPGLIITYTERHKWVGYFEFHGLGLHKEKKPCWFHRAMMKLLLGSEWKDETI